MPYSSKAIANYLLDLARNHGEALTPMKLQKLAYFAHGWNLAIRNTPLINESVEAWKFGPVIPSLYHDVKGYGMEPITAKIPVFRHTGLFRKHYYPAVGDKGDPNQEVRELIHRVWDE